MLIFCNNCNLLASKGLLEFANLHYSGTVYTNNANMFADVKLLGIDTLNKQLFIQKFKIPDCKIDTLSFKDINLIKIDNGTYLKEGLIAGVTIGGIIGLCSIKSNVSKNENNSRVISGLGLGGFLGLVFGALTKSDVYFFFKQPTNLTMNTSIDNIPFSNQKSFKINLSINLQ